MEGNQMKMREALAEARKVIKAMGGYWAMVTLPIIDAALSAPSRQCDVGTPEEQFKRYLAFCHSESHGCKHCPANRTRSHGTSNCDLVWAQMPYVEEGAGK